MRVLLVHQNFPGQFKHLAPALAARGDEVVAMTMNGGAPMPGVRIHSCPPKLGTGSQHPWAQETETKLIRAEAAFRQAMTLRESGFTPDVIVGHPAWGDMLFLKEVWPSARLGIYCEFFYGVDGLDHGFDPEFEDGHDTTEARTRIKLKTLPQRLHFPMANAAISPTSFQADTYPASFRERITVIHDGIDTDVIAPNPRASLKLGSGRAISQSDEIITFVSRNLEPYRGYHIFMRALPELLRRRPTARVIIVGAEGVSYGSKPSEGTWKARFLAEVQANLDMSRVHFVGSLEYPVFLELLAISRLHVYLTYPFVLSWSLMEAMALGTAILGSDTAPLREVIKDGRNGVLFPFFDGAALVDRAVELLTNGAMRDRIAAEARRTIVENYDLKTVCLPRQIAWIDALATMDPRPALFED
ncbi:glycosyltransferase [Sphingomonas oligophenolica]|uniref:Glycosyltransferase n=1 Tax=Sphingomonas oligophenolica TaxID=301154 RepID=A0A502CDT7_9SPHN|nr:glycosyltransferase [Sphingomonas oligophenolica]TPG10842.1 glycosyltransferase [Sphingomonas oligophenolica]